MIDYKEFVNKMKDIDKGSLVSICSCGNVGFNLMCNFCNEIAKESYHFFPPHGTKFYQIKT